MYDLVGGMAIIAFCALTLFVLTVRAARAHRPVALDLAGSLVVIGLFAYIRLVWQHPRLADFLPYSNLIVVANWLPLFIAALAGLVWVRMGKAPQRRLLVVSSLAVCGVVALVYPLLGRAPNCRDRWDRLGTCLQTTNHTCSPACAAMLLQKHGIAATEQEMADLCLTRSGTSWQGLYRGLKLKTAGSPWDVQVCQEPIDQLVRRYGGPMILSVGLAAGSPAKDELTREFGWVPGVNHSVVLESVRPGGSAVIADPSQELTREHWDCRTLDTLWRGTAIRLVRRES